MGGRTAPGPESHAASSSPSLAPRVGDLRRRGGLAAARRRGRDGGAGGGRGARDRRRAGRADPAQTITGFGASGAWWPNDADRFSAANRARIARLLFDRRAGLGLSIYRYNIGGGGVGVQPGARAPRSFLTAPGSYNWGADPGGTAFLRQAHRYGVRRLIGFANSAPPFFTTNGADCGGSLRPASVARVCGVPGAVAAHLRTAYAVRLTAVSPMNEPTNSFGDCAQEGMASGPRSGRR